MIAENNAPSFPDLTGKYFSAFAANLLNRGSATAIFVLPEAIFGAILVTLLVGP